MKKSYVSWERSKCRLLTLLLIVLVVVGSTANQVNGASVPLKGANLDKLYEKIFNASREQEAKKSGATTNIRHHLLYNLCSDRLVQLLRTGRKGVRAKGRMGKNIAFSKLRFESTDRNTIIIKAVHSNLHICFNQRGKLIARRKHKRIGCEFIERYSTDLTFTRYISANTRHTWFIGFNEKGKPVRGNSRTTVQEKCFNFLKIDDKEKKCLSGNGPSGVDFCDSKILGTVIPKDSRAFNVKGHKKHSNSNKQFGS